MWPAREDEYRVARKVLPNFTKQQDITEEDVWGKPEKDEQSTYFDKFLSTSKTLKNQFNQGQIQKAQNGDYFILVNGKKYMVPQAMAEGQLAQLRQHPPSQWNQPHQQFQGPPYPPYQQPVVMSPAQPWQQPLNQQAQGVVDQRLWAQAIGEASKDRRLQPGTQEFNNAAQRIYAALEKIETDKLARQLGQRPPAAAKGLTPPGRPASAAGSLGVGGRVVRRQKPQVRR